MSRIDFDSLVSKYPNLRRTWEELRDWFVNHSDMRTVDPVRLARALSDVPKDELAFALYLLVSEHWLQQKYAVQLPNGAFAPEIFDTPDDIPELIAGRLKDEVLETAACSIVPVLRSEEETASAL